MATAALLKPSQKTLDALNAWADKIAAETISDTPLKATLLFEALQKYNVSPAAFAESRGLTLDTVNAYLASRIDPTEQVDFHGTPYLEIDRAKVERQIRAVKQAANITFSGGMSDDWYTQDMAQKLATRGIGDIMDFSVQEKLVTLPAGTAVYQSSDDNGKTIYMVDVPIDFENSNHYPVDANNLQLIPGAADSEQSFVTKSAMTIDMGADYYFSKKTGKRFPTSGDTWESAFEGKGGVYYHVKFSDTGIPVFWTSWVDTNTFSQLAPFIGIAAMAFTFGGGAVWLGESILGAVGVTASPAVTAAVGNVAFNTAVTGGDVTHAVAGAAASFTGGVIGGQIGASVDSLAVGKAATVATTAALQGQKINPFSIATALTSGTKMDEDQTVDLYGPAPAVLPDGTSFFDTAAISLSDLGISTDPMLLSDSLSANEVALSANGIDIAAVSADSAGTVYTQTGDYVAMPQNQYAQSFYADEEGNVRSPDNRIVIPAAEATNMDYNQLAQKMDDDWRTHEGQTLPSEAPPASRPANLPPAANETKTPSITDQASSYDKLLKVAVSIGASIKSIASGKFNPGYATSPYGTARVQAVGVPVQRPDGSTITNNGNGTQTIRYPNGQVQTVATSYNANAFGGGLFAGINSQTLMIGGGVLLVALLLAKRK